MKIRSLVAGSAFALASVSLVYAAGGDPLAPIGLTEKQPVAPVKPVTETLFGTPITDQLPLHGKHGRRHGGVSEGARRLHAQSV
ncbi:MAG TPA: hypothetical protein VIJ62_14360 [Rhizomicrobium sp.]